MALITASDLLATSLSSLARFRKALLSLFISSFSDLLRHIKAPAAIGTNVLNTVITIVSVLKLPLINWTAANVLAPNSTGNNPQRLNMAANKPTSIHIAINGDDAPPVVIIISIVKAIIKR